MTTLESYLSEEFQLSPVEIKAITSYFKPVTLKKNEYFQMAGNRCAKIAFINQGVMRNYSTNEDGTEVVKYMTSDGDYNTVYQYFVSQEPCPESIQAVTDCELSVIGRTDFFQLREDSESFNKLIEKMVLKGLECKEQRLRSYLTEDAQKRYENLVQEQPKIVLHAPLHYIASYLGITRETLSRIRNKKVTTA